MTTSVSKNVVKVLALAVSALAVMPVPGASAGTSGTDRQLSIDCNADSNAGGDVTYNVRVNPGDTISIENIDGCDANLINSALVSEVTPPGNPTIVYQVSNTLAAGEYSGVVGDLGSEWPIVLGTVPQPTSWISLTVVDPIVKATPRVTLTGPGKAVKPGDKFILDGTVDVPQVRQVQKTTSSEFQVKLFKKTDSGWRSIQKLKTVDGAFAFGLSAKSTTKYQARTVATDSFKVGTSSTVRVDVQSKPTPPKKVVDISVSRKTVKQGNEVVVSASCGKACAGKDVRLQKRVGGEWKRFAHTQMNDRGRHSFGWDTVTLGMYKMRVVVKNYATSKVVSFEVVR